MGLVQLEERWQFLDMCRNEVLVHNESAISSYYFWHCRWISWWLVLLLSNKCQCGKYYAGTNDTTIILITSQADRSTMQQWNALYYIGIVPYTFLASSQLATEHRDRSCLPPVRLRRVCCALLFFILYCGYLIIRVCATCAISSILRVAALFSALHMTKIQRSIFSTVWIQRDYFAQVLTPRMSR